MGNRVKGGKAFNCISAAMLLIALSVVFVACNKPPKVEKTDCPLELEKIFHSRAGGFSIEYYKGWVVKEDDPVELFYAFEPDSKSNITARLLSRPELQDGDVDAVKEWLTTEILMSIPEKEVMIAGEVVIGDKRGYGIELKRVIESPQSAPVGGTDSDSANDASPGTMDTAPEAAESTPATAPSISEVAVRTLVIPRNKEALQITAAWDPGNEDVTQAVNCMFSSIHLWY